VADALAAAGEVPEVIIVGGAELFRPLLPQTSRLYLTLVDAELDGDAYFPPIDWSAWHETFRQHHPADERHHFAFTWLILERT
jgi:dihydrofolate reductase